MMGIPLMNPLANPLANSFVNPFVPYLGFENLILPEN